MKTIFALAVLALVAIQVNAKASNWMWSDPWNNPPASIGPYSEPVPLNLDPMCWCVYNWLGPHGYYNYWHLDDVTYATYHDADHWDPDPNIEIVPCSVCFVYIDGANTVFIDQDTWANDMHIGGEHWDDTTVILGHQEGTTVLTLYYDDIPEIFSVHGERLTTGQTMITIIGKGFGYEADGLTVQVTDWTQDRPWYEAYEPEDCDYPYGCDETGIPSEIVAPGTVWPCYNVRIFHHDSHVSCLIDTPDVFPQQLAVWIETSLRNPKVSASQTILATYIK